MDIQGDMQITLVIKAPNQRMEDQTVDCMLGWTIRKLKHHLESVYPSKPKHHEQRLIYSGKLLQDHLTLKEILKQYDTDINSSTHTVHLVCSNASSPSPKASACIPNSSPSQRAKESSPHPSVPTTPVSQSTSTSDLPPQQQSSSSLSSNAPTTEIPNLSSQNNDGVRYRGTGQSQQQSIPMPSMYQSFHGYPSYPNTGVPGTPPAGHPYTAEQYAWVVQQQQAYSQYMMQYMQYYQQNMYGGGLVGVGGQPFMSPFVTGTPPPTPTSLIPPQQQAAVVGGANEALAGDAAAGAGAVPQAQPQQQPRGNNNVRMNAQGGVDADDEDERDPRDWLHHTYFIMRFITFVGIIVFYSSFSRFIMVMGGFLVIYFFQKVRVAREQNQRLQQQEQQQREEEERQQQQQQQQEEGNDANGQQPPEAQGDEGTREETSPTATADQTDGPSHEEQQDSAAEGDSTATTGTDQEGGEQQAEEEEGNSVKRVLFFIYKTIELFFSSLVPAPPELMEAN